MPFLFFLFCLICCAACGDDDYCYPSVVQEYLTVFTASDGRLHTVVTDGGQTLPVADDRTGTHVKPDTAYRIVSNYELIPASGDEEAVRLYAVLNAIAPVPEPPDSFEDGVETEEADVLSWWLGYGYLNVVVTVRQQGKHLFHFVEDEVTTDAGGSRRVRLTLYHAVESEVQDYTKRGYLSVPLQQYFTEGVRSLDVTLCVHTASGVKTLELKQIGKTWKEGVF